MRTISIYFLLVVCIVACQPATDGKSEPVDTTVYPSQRIQQTDTTADTANRQDVNDDQRNRIKDTNP